MRSFFFGNKTVSTNSTSEEEEEEKLLKSLADPFLPKVFQFPELKKISLKKEGAVSGGDEKYTINFPSEEDATAFKSRLSQKCLSDGKKILADNKIEQLAENKKILTLSFPSGNTENIKKLYDRLKDSQSVYESNKAFEAKLDTSIKEKAAFVLNICGLLPIIPLISWGLGKVCQEVHVKTGFGSTAARTFLQIAKLGLEKSHLYSTEPGSTYGDPLSNIDKWLGEIDSRKKKAARSNYRFTPLITGVIGGASNAVSIALNYCGDGLDIVAEDINILARDEYIFKYPGYCLAACFSAAAIAFKASGMILRSAGSILSTDAILLADNEENRLSGFGKALRRLDNSVIEWRLEKNVAPGKKPSKEEKIIENLRGSPIQKGSDENLKAIQKTAFDLFKELKGPSFQTSGIKDDKNQYCEVATIKQKGNSYKLLFSPTTGDISIVDTRKDLNSAETKNSWNSDIEQETDRDEFKALVLSLANTTKTKPEKKTEGTITKASGQDIGLSSEDFRAKKSAGTAAKKSQADEHKIDGLEFNHNYSQYQYRENTLYRKGATKKYVAMNEIEEFKIINDLYKKYGKEILEGEKPPPR